ncbi:hypothetical protein GUJ93_ZPchr0002g24098 [Zizania palustris]|uniref:FLZ-type domain-containing protein n=1 Tax=Zizania palustris TaxID=103762 RepID=A0A8J5RXD4_ZIZPA|nr:hypothetical protein GUJ93_ZPchr0002g24098 [Zizania palustris]
MEGGGGAKAHFLDACFLCRKRLAGNRDIFMYRGDTPFCSEECRRTQMEAEAAPTPAEKQRELTRGVPPPRQVEGPQERGKVRAGSVLAL